MCRGTVKLAFLSITALLGAVLCTELGAAPPVKKMPRTSRKPKRPALPVSTVAPPAKDQPKGAPRPSTDVAPPQDPPKIAAKAIENAVEKGIEKAIEKTME
jgi:hypothetical protein